MTTHALLIGARGRGHIENIQKAALADEGRFLTRFAPESLVVGGNFSTFDFLQISNSDRIEDSRFYDGLPTTVLIEDIDGVTNECVKELVASLVTWTGNNPEAPVTFYWELIGLSPERTVELVEMLLPLVMLG